MKATVLLLFALFLTTAFAISTFSYTFPAQATSPNVRPSYSLGVLNNGSILAVTLQLPNPNGYSLSSLIVNIMDSTNTNVVQALSFSGSTSTAFWNVTANASYNLQVVASSGMSAVVIYYLSAIVNNISLLKLADVIRQNVFKYFYLNPGEAGSISITAYPSSASVTLLIMGSTNQFAIIGSTSLIPNSVINGYNQYTVTGLSSGFYGLLFTSPYVVAAALTFQSSSYPCPYSSQFADYYADFTGCTSESGAAPSGLPCINYDSSTLKCTGCLSGYTLATNGSCVISTNCGSRQYYHFGACYQVSDSCGEFDPYSGACVTCSDQNHYVINGQCVSNSLSFCSEGTHLYQTQCISNNCSVVNSVGECTVCASKAYYITNKTCIAIDCGAGFYFSVSLNNCTALPAQCFNFSTLTQSCYNCIGNYFLHNGKCEQPKGSQHCAQWNFDKNQCSQCVIGFKWGGSSCVTNIATPTNCPSRQVLVDNQCVYLPDNCLNINYLRFCTKCADNYELRQGVCTRCSGPNPYFPCVTCPSNQYVDSTGSCKSTNPYCSSINQGTGLCNSCTSGAAPVNGICCSSGEVVSNGSCVKESSSNGSTDPTTNPGDYYKYCLIYSPPSKLCTECRSGHDFDYGDHCA